MFANLSIEAAPKENALVIPAAALIRHSSQDRVVLALGEGRFRPAAVRAGTESGGLIEILDGLNAGETVVTSSQFLIDPGSSLDASLLRLTSSMKQEGGTEPQMQMDDMKTESAEAKRSPSMDKEMRDGRTAPPRAAKGVSPKSMPRHGGLRSITSRSRPSAGLPWSWGLRFRPMSISMHSRRERESASCCGETDAGREIVAPRGRFAAGNAAEDKQ